MKSPFAVFTPFFCLGIIAENFFRINQPILFWLSVFCLIAWFWRGWFIYLAVFFLGAALLASHNQNPACDVSNFIDPVNNGQLVKGVICEQPEISDRGLRFILRAQEIEFHQQRQGCRGNILVRSRAQNFAYGQSLILLGSLQLPRVYFQRRGISALMQAKVINLDENQTQGSLSVKKLALWLRNKFIRQIRKYLKGVTAGVLEAMVLGEKSGIPKHIYSAMIRTGTVHILVVSGMNVNLVVLIVNLVLKIFRVPRGPRLVLALFLIVIYCLLTGASTPVARATVMATVFIAAYFFRRDADIYNSLSLAALAILSFDPYQLFEISFQLSFISVFSLAFFYPKLRSFLRLDKFKNRPLKFLAEAGIASFSAWLGTAGFIAYYFRFFSPVTVLANIFIVPLAALITFCGFSLVSMSLVWPGSGCFFAVSTKLVILSLLAVNGFLAKLPFASFSWG